jgi:hypothetical protein
MRTPNATTPPARVSLRSSVFWGVGIVAGGILLTLPVLTIGFAAMLLGLYEPEWETPFAFTDLATFLLVALLTGPAGGTMFWVLQGLRRGVLGWVTLCTAVSFAAIHALSLAGDESSVGISASAAVLFGMFFGVHGWAAQRAGRDFWDFHY